MCYRLFSRVRQRQILLLSAAALRRKTHHIAFLVLAGRAFVLAGACESDRVAWTDRKPMTTTTVAPAGGASAKIDMAAVANQRLVLYYDHFSYYSQKVVMVLHEKKIPFISHPVDLFKSENYEPWFLNRLNPLGEVPVLDDNSKIIPGSALIIDYLEDNFSNGNTVRLIPMDQGPEVRQNVNYFRHMFQQVPAGKLTTGAVLHADLLQNPKIPFIGPVRTGLANAEKNGGAKLRELAEKVPKAKEELLKKAERREQQFNELSEEKNFRAILTDIDAILDKVEAELAKHTGDKEDWWLCSPQFTIADVELTILLIRIDQLGLEHLLWSSGKRPLVEKYFERVQKRDSYTKTVPGTFFFIKTLIVSQAPLLIGFVTVLALVMGGVFVARKYIH